MGSTNWIKIVISVTMMGTAVMLFCLVATPNALLLVGLSDPIRLRVCTGAGAFVVFLGFGYLFFRIFRMSA